VYFCFFWNVMFAEVVGYLENHVFHMREKWCLWRAWISWRGEFKAWIWRLRSPQRGLRLVPVGLSFLGLVVPSLRPTKSMEAVFPPLELFRYWHRYCLFKWSISRFNCEITKALFLFLYPAKFQSQYFRLPREIQIFLAVTVSLFFNSIYKCRQESIFLWN
jgi:hypothetical protein